MVASVSTTKLSENLLELKELPVTPAGFVHKNMLSVLVHKNGGLVFQFSLNNGLYVPRKFIDEKYWNT